MFFLSIISLIIKLMNIPLEQKEDCAQEGKVGGEN